ncbi:MAG TPA: hypothetical protein DEG92_05630 [Rikenellaceae bacterium]|nr:hypothetical protein [Rikenellaceae bacterium]
MFAPLLALAALALQISPSPADTTGKEDKLLRLISAQSAQLIERNGINYRKVSGPAQFLHNNTYIICDSAIWNIENNIIDAIGNVQIIQEQTALYGDRIHYLADSSMAQVRGNLVQLVDKERNRLRTHYLDYHTKDSVARFFRGGSMIDEKGNTIESLEGFYESKIKKFRFLKDVEMKVDSSTIIKSDSLSYLSQTKLTTFLGTTHIWQDSIYLRANAGWYNKENEQYYFKDNSYILTDKQEVWANSVLYDKKKGEARLFDNIQILDTTQNALFFGDYGQYNKDPFNVLLTKKPSVGYYTSDSTSRDTLFIAADTLKYYTQKIFELDSSYVSVSKKRLEQSKIDPMVSLLKGIKQKNKLSDRTSSQPGPPKSGKPAVKNRQSGLPPVPTSDSLKLNVLPAKPPEKIPSDTIAATKDTSLVRFALAYHKVRIYRKDMQAIADSLVFNSIDSIARMYKDPVMWNEGSQFTSDSMQFVTSKNKLVKAELISSAYYISKEDSLYFNQIKSADMIGFFRDNKLYRFDALGGASLLFFLAEDSVITSMNQKDCKFLSASVDSGKLQKVKYFDNIKSDVLPVKKLDKGKDRLKGFTWRESERPANRMEVCNRVIRVSERTKAGLEIQPLFPNTKRFFAETMKDETVKPETRAPIKKQTGKTDLPVKTVPVKTIQGELKRAPLPDVKR